MSAKTRVAESPLADLLGEALRFCRVQDALYARALAEAHTQARFTLAAEARCVCVCRGTLRVGASVLLIGVCVVCEFV